MLVPQLCVVWPYIGCHSGAAAALQSMLAAAAAAGTPCAPSPTITTKMALQDVYAMFGRTVMASSTHR